MKRPALLVALLTLIGFLAIPVLAQIKKNGSPRPKAPEGWIKFDWPEKKAVLFGLYAPTEEEIALIKKAVPQKLAAEPKKKRRILAFYKCDWPHSSIATALAAFQAIADQTKAYEIDTTDDPNQFSSENLTNYDAILLNNSVNFENFLNKEQKQAFLDFIKSGKGLIGIHAASDACKKWQEGADLIGGVFASHPWTSGGTWAVKVESPLHPLNAAWEGKGAFIKDEIYKYRDSTFTRERSRVLLSLDMSKQRNLVGKNIPSDKLSDINPKGDYPIAWIHEVGQGRVFYSNLGHNNFTYWNPKILKHFLDGIQYALGDLPADATPSAELENILTKPAPAKKIYLLAGAKSHPSGTHEYRAGSLLLADRLNAQNDLPIQAEVISGWPEDDSILDDAASIVIYCDSDSIIRDHYPRLMELSETGTGLLFLHYAVHPKNPQNGKDHYLPTIGGYMESGFSVNPMWIANLEIASDHPIRRGLPNPIKIFDELYYNMRFAEKSFPLATATPEKNKLKPTNHWNDLGAAGLGKPQTVLWGFENPKGTRGAAYTGGHFHRNWAHDGIRKTILNTIVWTAGLDVPNGGIQSKTPDEKEINANLDKKPNMTRIKLPLMTAEKYLEEFKTQKKKAAAEKANKKPPTPPKIEQATTQQTPPKPLAKAPETSTPSKWRSLLDKNLSHWDIWMGVPHKTVKIPDFPDPTSEDGMNGTPLGLNNDPLDTFSVIEENGHQVLKITGQIYGGLTTKEEFENYHITMQTKWGEKKWEPRLKDKRDSGLLLHCVGKHGAFWNVWKRSLEYQIQEKDNGDFIGLAGAGADIRIGTNEENRRAWDPTAELADASGYISHGPSEERPHGQWNTIDVYTVGDKMIFLSNGKVNMVLLNTRQNTPHGKAPLTKGQIQIQSEAAEIYFRDIKIRPITEFPTAFQKFLK